MTLDSGIIFKAAALVIAAAITVVFILPTFREAQPHCNIKTEYYGFLPDLSTMPDPSGADVFTHYVLPFGSEFETPEASGLPELITSLRASGAKIDLLVTAPSEAADSESLFIDFTQRVIELFELGKPDGIILLAEPGAAQIEPRLIATLLDGLDGISATPPLSVMVMPEQDNLAQFINTDDLPRINRLFFGTLQLTSEFQKSLRQQVETLAPSGDARRELLLKIIPTAIDVQFESDSELTHDMVHYAGDNFAGIGFTLHNQQQLTAQLKAACAAH